MTEAAATTTTTPAQNTTQFSLEGSPRRDHHQLVLAPSRRTSRVIKKMERTSTNFKLSPSSMATLKCILALAAVACLAEAFPQQQNHHQQPTRQRAVFARRAADDSRPLPARATNRAADDSSSPAAVVVGKFRAPAPEQIHQQRIPKRGLNSAQTMTASFRVADDNSQPEKIVHGIMGASTATNKEQQPQQYRQKTVGAKFLVSDEGLNYPPSKLSADIYGNVAEIVTAPPEAVEDDFLIPTSSIHQTQPKQQPKARRSN